MYWSLKDIITLGENADSRVERQKLAPLPRCVEKILSLLLIIEKMKTPKIKSGFIRFERV